MRTPPLLPALGSTALCALAGCTSLTGLGGDSHYACKAPEGVACQSVSGTYANVAATGQAAPARADKASPASPPPVAGRSPDPVARPQATAASPLRSASKVLRLWIKPWEDLDGDLFDQGYVYVQVDTGLWLLDHLQRSIRETYAPTRPPASRSEAPVTEAAPASPMQRPTWPPPARAPASRAPSSDLPRSSTP